MLQVLRIIHGIQEEMPNLELDCRLELGHGAPRAHLRRHESSLLAENVSILLKSRETPKSTAIKRRTKLDFLHGIKRDKQLCRESVKKHLHLLREPLKRSSRVLA
jgi:hypothetical protein